MDLRTGRCPSCGHGETVETTPRVTADGQRCELEAFGGERLELWTCARCGLSQLAVRDPQRLVKAARAHARRVLAEPPEGAYDLRINNEIPSDSGLRVAMESKIAFFLGVSPREVARMLDGPLPITLTRGVPWNQAEHGRSLLARAEIAAEVAPSAPVGYRG